MRLELLEGTLPLPGSEKLRAVFPKEYELIEVMWSALWTAFLNNSPLNSTYWYDKFAEVGATKAFNIVVLSLSKAGWVHSDAIPARNWAEMAIVKDKVLEFVTLDELENIKASYKFNKYQLSCVVKDYSVLTKIGGTVKDTGLVRKGFTQASVTQYGFDTAVMAKYADAINRNLAKSMEKIREFYPDKAINKADYDAVAVSLFAQYSKSPEEVYTLEGNIW